MNKLPQRFVEEGTELAKGALFMGHRFEDLSREELIAVAAKGWADARTARHEALADLRLLGRRQ